MAGIQQDPFKIISWLRLFALKFPAYSDIKTWEFSNFAFKTVEIRFFCNNHAFQSSLLFYFTIFLLTGDFFFQLENFFIRLSSLCFQNSDLHRVWNCLCWHNAAVDSRVESNRLPFSLGRLALYYETTDARNNGTWSSNEYMARELKEGYNKYPPASRRLTQTIFPTESAAGLLEG